MIRLSSIKDALLGDDPARWMQAAGMVVSAYAATLYIMRWRSINNIVFNEFQYIDYGKGKHQLTNLQEVSCAGRDKTVAAIKAITCSENSSEIYKNSPFPESITNRSGGQLLCVWGRDQFITESVVHKAFIKAELRVIELDFHNVVWAEDFGLWMKRMEQTSNPTHSMLQTLSTALSYLTGGSDIFTAKFNNDTNADENELSNNAKLAQFRMLQREKEAQTRSIFERDPSRPLVLFIRGLDRLQLMQHSLQGQMGKRVIAEYLEGLLNYVDVITNDRYQSNIIHNHKNKQHSPKAASIHVVVTVSDQFWYQHWLSNEKMRNHSLTLHLEALPLRIWHNAWYNYIVRGTSDNSFNDVNSTNLLINNNEIKDTTVQRNDNKITSHRGELLQNDNDPSLAAFNEMLHVVLQSYGMNVVDIQRALGALLSGVKSSYDQLIEEDISNQIFSFLQDNPYVIVNSLTKSNRKETKKSKNQPQARNENGDDKLSNKDCCSTERNNITGHGYIINYTAAERSWHRKKIIMRLLVQSPTGRVSLDELLEKESLLNCSTHERLNKNNSDDEVDEEENEEENEEEEANEGARKALPDDTTLFSTAMELVQKGWLMIGQEEDERNYCTNAPTKISSDCRANSSNDPNPMNPANIASTHIYPPPSTSPMNSTIITDHNKAEKNKSGIAVSARNKIIDWKRRATMGNNQSPIITRLYVTTTRPLDLFAFETLIQEM